MRKATMKRLALFVALLATPAFAQEAPKTYTLTVTSAELATIGTALGVLPYKDVSAIIAKLSQQINEQDRLAQKPDGKDQQK